MTARAVRTTAILGAIALSYAIAARAEPTPSASPPAAAKTAAPSAAAPAPAASAPTPTGGAGAPATTPETPPAATTAPSEGAAPSVAPTPEAAAGTPPGSAPPPPPGGPPPHYYVEPQPSGGPGAEGIYEPPPPPPPIYEPPPPAPPDNRAPKTAFWVGARVSWLIPFGSVWIDGFSGPSGVYYRRRTFSNYASPGPAGEIDVGARLSRRYLLFALYQHATLGTGNLDEHAFGGQERGATNLYGVGLRFSTEPATIGFAMELALGYRDFRAYWADGTELEMTDGILDARLGLGMDIRMNRYFSLSPMLVLGGGSFGDGHFDGPHGKQDVQSSYDETGEYGTLEFQLGAHFDVY